MAIFRVELTAWSGRILGSLLVLYLALSLSVTELAPWQAHSYAPKPPSSETVASFSQTSPDFAMSISQSVIHHVFGQSESATIVLTSLNSFSGTIALTRLGDLRRVVLDPYPSTINLTPGIPGISSLTVDPLTQGGVYTGLVLGTSGPIAHSAPITIVARPSLVCVAPSGATSCDETPSMITGPSPATGSQLRVAVVLGGSPVPEVDGFRITLLANHLILKPAGIDLTGTSLPGPPSFVSQCIGGVPKMGGNCVPTDSVDTIDLAVVGQFAQSSSFPGLLFTAIYNVTGSTSGTTIGFQTGCNAPTSVPTDTCITIVQGIPQPVPEEAQGALFSNLPSIAAGATPGFLVIPRGLSDLSTLTFNSVNGFSGNLSLSARSPPSGVQVDLTPPSLVLSPDSSPGFGFLSVSVANDTQPGEYDVTAVGTNGTMSVSVTITIDVPQPDFVMVAYPRSMIVYAGSTKTSTILIAGMNSFEGNVSLTVNPLNGINTSLSTATLTVSDGVVVETSLAITPTDRGGFDIFVIASSDGLTHDVEVGVVVPGFDLFSLPGLFNGTAVVGSVEEIMLLVIPDRGFNGTVTLSESVNPTVGLSLSCNPSSVILNSTSFVQTSDCSLLGFLAGNYTVTITGRSGILSRSERFSMSVVSSPPIVVQLHWKHRVSLSRVNDTIVFVAGLYNPNNVTLFAIPQIFLSGFPKLLVAESGVLTLRPGENLLNIPIAFTLNAQDIGNWTFRIQVDWWSGSTFGYLRLTSNTSAAGIPSTGTFTVLA